MKKLLKLFKRQFFVTIAFLISRNKNVLKCYINGYVKFNGKEKLGDNVHFNGCKVYGNGVVTFGDNFHSAKGLIFLTTYHNHDGEKLPYDQTIINKDIVIEDNVWIGMNVMILGGVTIGEGAVIQAGSVVSKSIPKFSIAGGNPALPFKARNVEKYHTLKANKKFL